MEGSQGHEQKNERPSIVWRDFDHLGMAIIIPFTSSIERENMAHTHCVTPNAKNGLEKESIALLFQMRAIEKKRFIKKLGELGESDVKSIASLMKDMLRL